MAHLTKMKQHVLRTVMIVLTCLCALPSEAAIINYTPPEGEKISFTVLTSDNFWKNTPDYVEAESLGEAAGTTWKSFGFKYNGDGLKWGLNMDLTSKIWNVNPVPEGISTIATEIGVASDKFCSYIKDVSLEISDSEDFVNPVILKAETPLIDDNGYGIMRKVIEFNVEKPENNKYYRINYNLKKMPSLPSGYDYWFYVNFVIGCESAIEVPVLTANAEKTEYTVVSNTGELHLLLAKYNSEGQLIEEIEPADGNPGAQAKVPAAEDTSWRHKVKDINESYTFSAPGENEYLALRAKTVAGTAQSAEITHFIRKDGVITGASNIVMAEETGSERWFNMQGNEVSAPSKGIFIRVKSGKAEKVIF